MLTAKEAGGVKYVCTTDNDRVEEEQLTVCVPVPVQRLQTDPM